jgi:hypothetical protein
MRAHLSKKAEKLILHLTNQNMQLIGVTLLLLELD